MDPAEISSEAYLRRDGGRFGAVSKGSFNGHLTADRYASTKRAPSPLQKHLALNLNKMVRYIFSHRGLIRYK